MLAYPKESEGVFKWAFVLRPVDNFGACVGSKFSTNITSFNRIHHQYLSSYKAKSIPSFWGEQNPQGCVGVAWKQKTKTRTIWTAEYTHIQKIIPNCKIALESWYSEQSTQNILKPKPKAINPMYSLYAEHEMPSDQMPNMRASRHQTKTFRMKPLHDSLNSGMSSPAQNQNIYIQRLMVFQNNKEFWFSMH